VVPKTRGITSLSRSALGQEVIRMAKSSSTNPGKPAPKSGQYRPAKGGAETTISKGKTLPPTPKGGPWKLVDPSKNKSGR
jgi:hypothetical protein